MASTWPFSLALLRLGPSPKPCLANLPGVIALVVGRSPLGEAWGIAILALAKAMTSQFTRAFEFGGGRSGRGGAPGEGGGVRGGRGEGEEVNTPILRPSPDM